MYSHYLIWCNYQSLLTVSLSVFDHMATCHNRVFINDQITKKNNPLTPHPEKEQGRKHSKKEYVLKIYFKGCID